MSNKTSQHILPTAANLLGFCLIVITSLHISSATNNSLLDEFASIVALLLCVSVISSFASIKTRTKIWTIGGNYCRTSFWSFHSRNRLDCFGDLKKILASIKT